MPGFKGIGMIVFILIAALGAYLIHLFNNSDIKKSRDIITVWFGVPGAGKTTMAAYLCKGDIQTFNKAVRSKRRRRRKYRDIPVANVPIKGARVLDAAKDLGIYNVSDCRVIIDEASIEFNNRKFKELPQHVIKWFKLHRHYCTQIDVFSQSYDDMDITIRRLAQRYYHLRKSILPFCVSYRRIKRVVGIDKETRQIVDQYDYVPFSRHLVFCPPLWKLFDTLDAPVLEEKTWEIYAET